MYENRKLSKRTLLALIVTLATLIAFVAVGIASRFWSDADSSVNVGGDHVTDAGPIVSFDNFTYLSQITGGIPVGVSSLLQGIIIEDGSDADEYRVKVDNSTVTDEVSFPFSIYTFVLNISDGRRYSVGLALNDDRMYGILVRRTLPTTSEPRLYILNSDDGRAEYNSDINVIMAWAKGIYPDGLVVTTE